MNKKLKIQSFTLAEMIVVMILTTIVAGISFTVLNLVQKYMQAIDHSYEIKSDWTQLEHALWTDFNRFNHLKYDPADSQLLLRHNLDSATYRFHDDYITRESDTFKIGRFDFHLKFEGLEPTGELIDAVKLSSKSNSNLRLFVYAINDATRFMN